MEFFQLHHPLIVIVLCDRRGCEQVADYHGVRSGQGFSFETRSLRAQDEAYRTTFDLRLSEETIAD